MSDKQRRKLIKTAALGGAILSVKEAQSGWVKPVVEAVTLPAHAATSVAAGGPNSFAGVPGNVQLDKPGNPLIDALINKAHAIDSRQVVSLFIDLSCIKKTSATKCRVNAIGPGVILDASGVPIGGDPVLMMETPCLISIPTDSDLTMDGSKSSRASGAAALLSALGLVDTAHAGGEVVAEGGIYVQVDSIGATADGRFLIDVLELELPFSLPAQPCQNATCDVFDVMEAQEPF